MNLIKGFLMKGKEKNHENEGFFMGYETVKMRLVLEEGKGEKGACSSILPWELAGFLRGEKAQ